MKKSVKIIFIVFGVVIALFIVLTIAIKAYLTPERVKSFLIPEAEKALNRKVNISDISIGIFRGIGVKDFSVKDADEKTDFVKCKEFIIKYRLLPLLSKKIVISQIRVVSPEILVVRGHDGKFNYEGIGKKPDAQKKETTKPEARPLPVTLLIDSIKVTDARFSFTDRKKEMPVVKGLLNADMSVALANDNAQKTEAIKSMIEGLKIEGSISIDEVNIEHKEVKALITGDVKFSDQSVNFDIKSTIGKNIAQIKGQAINLFSTPDINLNIYAKQLYLNELIPAGKPADVPASEKREANTVQKSKQAPASQKPMDLKITASGEVRIDSAMYEKMEMRDFVLVYKLKNNVFEISDLTALIGKGKLGFKSTLDLSKPGFAYKASGRIDSIHAEEMVNAFFPKAKDTVFGALSMNMSLSGAGTSPDILKKNLIADAEFNIRDGKITNSKISDNLALFLGINELKTVHIRQGDGTIKVRNGVARLDSMFTSDDVSMNPSGNIGLNETLDLAFDLKLSPRLTSAITRSSNVSSYIKDDKGWGSVPLKITGTFAKPSYSVDLSKAGKRIIEKKGEELLKKLFK